MKTGLFVVILIVGLLAGGVLYVKNSNSASAEPVSGDQMMENTETPIQEADAVNTSGSMMEGVKDVLIEGSEFKFSLPTLTLKKGEKVRLVFTNSGKMTHDWVVDELNVRTKIINGGQTDTIEFTPETAGTFEYYCSVGQHRANGMTGTLTVTE